MNKKDCVEIVLRLLDVRVLGHTYEWEYKQRSQHDWNTGVYRDKKLSAGYERL